MSRRRRFRRRQGDAENGVGAQPLLVLGPVQIAQQLVEATLIVRVEAIEGFADFAVDPLDGLLAPLPP